LLTAACVAHEQYKGFFLNIGMNPNTGVIVVFPRQNLLFVVVDKRKASCVYNQVTTKIYWKWKYLQARKNNS